MSHAKEQVWLPPRARTNAGLAGSTAERYVMPDWIEILINVIGYGGFVAIANCTKAHDEKSPET